MKRTDTLEIGYVYKQAEAICLSKIMLKMLWCVLLLIPLIEIHAHPDSSLEVTIKQGTLRGHLVYSRKGRGILAFQRIPFARPPVGELRFKSPQSPEPWSGVLDATRTAPICIQRNIFTSDDISGEEDCLYLNVYMPQRKTRKLDVMMYLHTGGWLGGTGSYVQPKFLLDHDIVLVTINFRLGPLGFLSTGDKACPGNNGLKDQVAALRWIQDNIAAFGGNPNSVTVFGGSSGASSAHYHVLSPASRGLIHRAISQSGTAVSIWAIAPNGSTAHHTKKLASLLDCPTECNRELISCLRHRDAADIIRTDVYFMEWDIFPTIIFKPVLETEVDSGDEMFLPAHPLKLLENSNPVPWMTGIASSDGALIASRLYGKNLIEDLDKHFLLVAPLTIQYLGIPKYLQDQISKKIREFYFKDEAIGRHNARQVVDMYTDGAFLSAADQAVKLHLKTGSPVYLYYFDYRGTDSYSTTFGDPISNYGASHDDELLYLFYDNVTFPNRTLSENDNKMVDLMTSVWVNFARTGNPTPDGNKHGRWPQVTSEEYPELGHIELNGVHIEAGLFVERAQFWAQLPVRAPIPHNMGFKTVGSDNCYFKWYSQYVPEYYESFIS